MHLSAVASTAAVRQRSAILVACWDAEQSSLYLLTSYVRVIYHPGPQPISDRHGEHIPDPHHFCVGFGYVVAVIRSVRAAPHGANRDQKR